MVKQYFVMERRNPNTRPQEQYESDAEFTKAIQWKMHYNTLYDSRENAIKDTKWYGDPQCYTEYKVVDFEASGTGLK